jgi:hypothetical protein
MGLFSKPQTTDTDEPAKLDVGTVLKGMVDRRRDALYDRVQLPAGAFMPSLATCFQVPVGCEDPWKVHVPNASRSTIKTFMDTNMMAYGQLNPPHDFIVQRVLFLFQPSTSQRDRNALLAAYQWDFKIMEKVMNREPVLVSAAVGKPENIVQNFGKGSWLDDKGDRENDSTSKIEKLGVGICWDLGDHAKYLPPLVNFRVTLEGTPFQLWLDLDFYVMIDGLRDFAVQ